MSNIQQIHPNDSWVVDNDGNVVGVQTRNAATTIGNVVAAVDPLTGKVKTYVGEIEVPNAQINPALICHLFAGNITPDDSKFIDSSGNSNHGTRGANLSIAQMGAVAGYASAIGPTTGALDSVIHIPSFNFDYSAGESLLVYWRGKAAAPAAERNLFGDYLNPKGFRIRVDATGVCDLIMYGTGGSASSGWGSVIADGTVHDVAWFLDGANQIAYKIYDGSLVLTQTNYAKTVGDAKSTQQMSIGGHANLIDSSGLNCATRLFTALRWQSGDQPNITAVVAAVKKLRDNPSRPLTSSDI